MKSQQQLLASILSVVASHHGVASAASSPPGNRLRAFSQIIGESSTPTSEDDIPDMADTRHRFLETDYRDVPQNCLSLLAASTDENGAIKKENYYVLTDGLSNGYYSFSDMNSYSDLPYTNKFAFVTLSCLCSKQFGQADNCCQGNRAHLDMTGLDVENPQLMDEEMQFYVYDICRTTSDAVGTNVLPPTGELPVPTTTTTSTTTASTTTASISTTVSGSASIPANEPTFGGMLGNGGMLGLTPTTKTQVPSASPSGLASTISAISEGEGGDDGTSTEEAGMTTGAKAGIAVAGAVGLLLALLLGAVYFRRKKNGEEIVATDDTKSIVQDLRGMEILPDDESHGIATQGTHESVQTQDYEPFQTRMHEV